MIYPVRNWSKWYVAQGFGNKTDYGYHEGLDINLKTGGDSDLGQDLLAVADGKIVYFHNASHPTSGFGRHMVLECDTSRGKRWYHYCHCQEITSQVKEVKQGDVIGKLGKSGTTYAHLHFSVFKVDPKTLYKGIDSIAKTLTDLNNWWEEFAILPIITPPMPGKYTEEEMTKVREERDKNWNLYQDEKEVTTELKNQVEAKDDSISDLKRDHQTFLDKIASILWGEGEPTISDETAIIEKIKELTSGKETVNELRVKLDKEIQDHKKTVLSYEDRFEKFKLEMSMLKDEYERKLANVEARVDEEIAELKKKQEQYSFMVKVGEWFSKLFNKK